MICDLISDLHGHYPQLEGGDLLIVAGDLTARDTISEWKHFIDWLRDQKYKKKIYIGGNHDYLLTHAVPCIDETIEYLCDSGTEFEGLKIWGSPWSLTFSGMNPHCKAFTVDTEEELAEKWAFIPDDINILITHSPPYRILDKNYIRDDCGSDSLMCRVQKLNLKLHVFGHIHESYGKRNDIHPLWCSANTIFVNASHVDENYRPVNKPVRIEL